MNLPRGRSLPHAKGIESSTGSSRKTSRHLLIWIRGDTPDLPQAFALTLWSRMAVGGFARAGEGAKGGSALEADVVAELGRRAEVGCVLAVAAVRLSGR